MKRIVKKFLRFFSDQENERKKAIQAPHLQRSRFLSDFLADEYGHRANIETGDLGYGWLHYGLIRATHAQSVLCVGSRYGYIPAVLAQACKDAGHGSVDFVDAGFDETSEHGWTGVGYWKTEKGKNIFVEQQLQEYITVFVETTDEFCSKYKHQLYDYIYIDGDHSYKGAKNDLNLFFKRLKPGGFMVFHDICVKETLAEGEYGVHKVWSELCKKSRHTIQLDFLGSGLGIIQKN